MIRRGIRLLDRALRRLYGIRTPAGAPGGMFGYRLARDRDGAPVVEVHLRSEAVPAFGAAGPDLAWGRRAFRGAVEGLAAVAREIARDPELARARGVVATTILLSPFRRPGARRVLARLGFEARLPRAAGGPVRSAGDRLWAAALAWAYQPGSRIAAPARAPVAELWIPMPELLARYAGRPTSARRPSARASTDE